MCIICVKITIVFSFYKDQGFNSMCHQTDELIHLASGIVPVSWMFCSFAKCKSLYINTAVWSGPNFKSETAYLGDILLHIPELYLLPTYTDTDHLFIVLKNAPVSAREVLPTWDKQIQSLCYQVNQIIEKITNNDQEWITKAMEEQMVH